MPEPRLFTIPPGAPFLPTLADALVSGRLVGPLGDDPLALAAVTLYLPTRRAVRALGGVLAERLGRAALLPRLIALGEGDDAEFDIAAGGAPGAARAVLAPSMPPLERRLVLMGLVQAWARSVDRALLPLGEGVPFGVPSSPADAVALAGDVEGLMDALTVEGVPWEEIAGAVEAEYSRYFGLTLDFLRIAAEHWPRILGERDLSDPVFRARSLVVAEAERLARETPADPVIVAGSTGSTPATARLIRAVLGLPRGAAVLPGLDGDLDEAGWAAIGTEGEIAHGHPQAVLHRLLERDLRLSRSAAIRLGEVSETVRAREAMLSQALRPAATTDAWARLDPAERDRLVTLGLDGLSVVEAGDEREEALIAAIALRETLETPGRVAALVTPDRALAMRVAAELARWDIRAEDAAGQPLSGSLGGRLARLAAEFAVETVGPRIGNRQAQRLLALLAHPLVRLGMARPELVRGAAALEIGVLRGPALAPGFETLRGALAAAKTDTGRRPRPKRRLKDIDWELAEKLVAALEDAFKGFPGGAGALDLVAAGEAHRAVCEALLKGPEGDEEAAADPSLACLDSLFDELAFVDAGPMGGEFSDYPAFFAALADLRCVPDAHGAPHPRVRILGLAEARLLSCDRIVLGGLDEGVWPARMVTDSFLNRPMRERIGLDPPERQIGQGAHDFVGLLGHRDAVITRAQKREGAPTVQSRFLQRMRAFADQTHWEAVLTRGRRLAGLAARLDAGTEPPPPRLTQPRPRPDPALFPRALSVTEVETLVRDPYAIFARHVLGLDPLEPVAAPPGVGDRGTLIHAVLGRFAEAFPQGMPADADTRLAAIAEEVFAPVKAANPELYAEWWPRLQRLSEKFLPWEAERRAAGLRVHAEANGRWSIPMGDEVFVLKARADRIETRRDGGACLIDFKTGTPPSNREVFAGFSPQLTLEAAMLMAGAFKDIPAPGTVPDLLYVHASGGRTPLRERLLKPEKDEERDIAALVEEHAARLRGLVARFMTGKAAYVSRPYPKYVRYAGDYDHLARVLEWSLAGEGEA